jgi:hypothetical protein
MKSFAQPSAIVCLVGLLALGLLISACQPASNTNTNTNLLVNASPANVNANVAPVSPSVIAAKEPDAYRATLVLSAETEGGEKTIGIPTLSAEVARSGADRRVSFKLPDGSDLVYLEKAGMHIVIAPARKQYAELTPEATGFQLWNLMTPGQLVARLEKLQGVEQVGEEAVNGRPAMKYRYQHVANTNTQAGSVSTEAFVFVDKETGLPLRSELYTEASGNVQGVKGAKVVAEMRDIAMVVDPTLFEVPLGFSKVPPAQVKQQIDALTNTAASLIKALMSNMSTSNTNTAPAGSPAPITSPSPHE